MEPIHVHVSEGRPTKNSTKVWITGSGHSLLCNNNSKIPKDDLKKILRMIEANSNEIMEKWYEKPGASHPFNIFSVVRFSQGYLSPMFAMPFSVVNLKALFEKNSGQSLLSLLQPILAFYLQLSLR